MSDLLIDAVADVLGSWETIRKNGDLNFCCPSCSGGDNNHHLGINFDKEVFNCWKCGYKGTLRKLCRDVGIRYKDFSSDTYVPTDKELLDYVGTHLREAVKITDSLPPAVLPDEFEDIFDDGIPQRYLDYLNDRCSPAVLRAYRVGVCTDGHYAGRVIVPVYDRKWRLRYYTARAIRTPKSEEAKKNHRKYLNPDGVAVRGVRKAQLLFGENMIVRDTTTLLLMEGVFDALRFASYRKSFPGVVPLASMGKHPSLEQRTILTAYAKKGLNIVVMFDEDDKHAYRDAHKAAYALFGRIRNVRVARAAPGKDPGTMTRDEFAYSLAHTTAPEEPILDAKLLRDLGFSN